MAVYIIGYDLHPKRGETYAELTEAIKALGTDWWHCLDSTWLVKTSKTCVQVRDTLWKHMNSDDQLLVIQYGAEVAAWVGFSDECGNWLETNL